MWSRFVRRRAAWQPTILGSFCILLMLSIAVVWGCWRCEGFLSQTRRLPADVLVVEGWIGREGVRAAGQEFEQRGYKYLVAAGGPASDRWDEDRLSYAQKAADELIRSGIPSDRIIVASARDTERQRTFESAVAVWRALQARSIHPKALNVFTLGSHARRSRLVVAKVYGSGTDIGVIDWVPPHAAALPWWRSSERAREVLAETAAYVFEVTLNSGRLSNSPTEDGSSGSVSHPKELVR
jgi:hypothetical protein